MRQNGNIPITVVAIGLSPWSAWADPVNAPFMDNAGIGTTGLGDQLVAGRIVIDVPEEFRLVSELDGLTVPVTALGPTSEELSR